MGKRDVVAASEVERLILVVRGLLDTDLANMYGVEVRVLNQAVRRNIARFPEDFMLRLTPGEVTS